MSTGDETVMGSAKGSTGGEPGRAGDRLLHVEAMTARYGPITAVRGVGFEVYEGEIVTILGANGAGKSTILNSIMRLVPDVHGMVKFRDIDLIPLSTEAVVRLGIALVPERRRLFYNLSVAENLALGAAVRTTRASEAELSSVFELFPVLRERYRSSASTLSGGQQQMLAIARALVGRPEILLLDEPSLGLAPRLVEQLFELIADLRRQGMTIVLVEQSIEGALQVADRGYVLHAGRGILSAPASELRESGSLLSAYLKGQDPARDRQATNSGETVR